MRISDMSMYQNLSQNIDQAQAAYVKTQQEASSGLAINQPSDNPSGTATVLNLQAALSQTQSFQNNAQTAQSQMQSADQALGQVQSVVTSAMSLAEQGANNTLTASELQALSQQAGGILGQVQSLANTQYNGQYVFSGISQQAPVVAGAYNSAATSSAQQLEIGSGVTIPVSVDGNQAFNTAVPSGQTLTNGSSATLLNVLSSLQTDLASGNTAAVEADLGALQAQVGNLSSVRAALGADMNRVQAAISQLTNASVTLQKQQGSVQNIDLAQVIAQLSNQQMAYQAAVAAGANLKLPTLANYLT